MISFQKPFLYHSRIWARRWEMFLSWTNTHFHLLKQCVHSPSHNFLSIYCSGLLLQQVVLNIQFPILVSGVVRRVCWQCIFGLRRISKQGEIKWKASVSSTWKWSPCFVFPSAGNKADWNGAAGPQRRHYYTPQTVLWLRNGSRGVGECRRCQPFLQCGALSFKEIRASFESWKLPPPYDFKSQPARFLKVFH